MDLTDYDQKCLSYGDRHSNYSNMFWNGLEWQEDKPSIFWDFDLGKDWWLLVVCGSVVLLAGGILIAVIN